MTNADSVLAYLRSTTPKRATIRSPGEKGRRGLGAAGPGRSGRRKGDGGGEWQIRCQV